ncbi:hypothetical protein J3Q64DRAFT_1694582 [Phycomyces blakesleeanus]|uniref:Uncharacterized protein n=1 Tax=Phycomyces blakesleeanus TaxID=4837 RepID=A0ABR3BIH9_PHYBL
MQYENLDKNKKSNKLKQIFFTYYLGSNLVQTCIFLLSLDSILVIISFSISDYTPRTETERTSLPPCSVLHIHEEQASKYSVRHSWLSRPLNSAGQSKLSNSLLHQNRPLCFYNFFLFFHVSYKLRYSDRFRHSERFQIELPLQPIFLL